MKKILALTAALVMGVATALAVGQFMTSKPATITAKAQWKNVYRTQSGLVAGADLIVLAEHASAEPGRIVGFDEDALPFTNNTFKVERILKGDYEGSELVVEQTGGVMANGTVFSVDDGGPYEIGGRYLLFLNSNEKGAFYVINHQARYNVRGDELEGVDPTDSVVASFHRAKFTEAGETIRERAKLFK
jgi:hypothetical protein